MSNPNPLAKANGNTILFYKTPLPFSSNSNIIR